MALQKANANVPPKKGQNKQCNFSLQKRNAAKENYKD
jgi:hypothetical protein